MDLDFSLVLKYLESSVNTKRKWQVRYEMLEAQSMRGLKRNGYCGRLTTDDAGREVVVMGWVQVRRDHGGLIFLDLRDRSGVVQVVCDPASPEAFAKAQDVRNEYVLAVTGVVAGRPEGTENPALASGRIEVRARELRVLNISHTPPFYIEDGVEVDEGMRLRYRYLDLRRPEMQRQLALRHQAARSVRDFLDSEGFWEVETPVLGRSTPEGARDFLVPSRLNPGRFYALPQSPQLFKQILMVAGVERYFQIVRCFRDEDLRADRQPEFTQIDLELSFVGEEDVISLTERMMARLFRDTLGRELPLPLPRLSYAEAMLRYGSDKPDLRFSLEIRDVTDVAASCGFKVFQAAVAQGGVVRGIAAPGAGSFSRREIDELTAYVAGYGAKGLAYLFVEEEGVRSPVAKFFTAGELAALSGRLGAKPGDLCLLVADSGEVAARSLGALRLHLAQRLNLIGADRFSFLWVTGFPLLEYDADEKRFKAVHHPFTAPRDEDLPILETDPGQVLSRAYDIVLNGVELGGGSIRIHQRQVQERMFKAIGLSMEEAREQFGYLLDAFEYGTPPHGGIAFGFDRLLMLLSGRETIRDVIPFPKTQSAADLMVRAPGPVSAVQLRDLHLKSTMPVRPE